MKNKVCVQKTEQQHILIDIAIIIWCEEIV